MCLSDTCGTLKVEDFIYIVDRCYSQGIPYELFSLHLHVKPEREDEIKKIMYAALDRKITQFDVSHLTSGGCSVTIDSKDLAPNLSYDLYYDTLINYINEKSKL